MNMGLLILVIIIIIFELMQILCSRFKVIKWILPTLSFLNSINIFLAMIVFEGKEDYFKYENFIGNIAIFLISNIPTIIFTITNLIISKKEKNNKEVISSLEKEKLDKKQKRLFAIAILIIIISILAFLICLLLFVAPFFLFFIARQN